jgi:NADPH2:quinone reductase
VWAFGHGIGLARNGTIAASAVLPSAALYDVPEGADPALACALGIAGIAGWIPVSRRAPVRHGETVLVLGATGTAGSVAAQGAKALGAGRVIAAGRDRAALDRALELGADRAVTLDELASVVEEEKPSLVIDPLWGPPLEAVVAAAAPGTRIVNLGQSAGGEATLTSAAVRGKQLELLGHSNFGIPHDVMQEEYARLVELALDGKLTVDLERVPLDGVADAWERQAGGAHAKLVVDLDL